MRVRHRIPATGAVMLAALVLISTWPTFAVGQVAGSILDVLMSGGADRSGVLPDAFRTDLSCDRGIWSTYRFTGQPTLEIERHHFEPLTSRSTTGDAATFDRLTELRYLHPFRVRSWDLQVGGSLDDVDAVTWASDSDGTTNLRGSSSIMGAFLHVRERNYGFEFLAAAPLWRSTSDSPAEYAGWGIRYSPDRRLVLQTSREFTDARTGFSSKVIDDQVVFGLNIAQQTWRLATRVAPIRRLAVDFEWADSVIDPLAETTDQHRYELSPQGFHRGGRGAVTCSLGKGHDLVYGVVDMKTDLEAGAYWGGQRFGWLSYLDNRLRSRILGWRWTPRGSWQTQSEWERSRTYGRGRAKIESWPFTSTIVDLLGVKQVAYGEWNLEWDRLSCLVSREGRGSSLALGGAYYRISPHAILATWRPAFLNIGRTDYRYRELDVRRVQLASLLLRGEVDLWSSGIFELSLQQFLWADVQEVDGSGSDDSGDPPGDDGPALDGWYGGTYLVAGVKWRL